MMVLPKIFQTNTVDCPFNIITSVYFQSPVASQVNVNKALTMLNVRPSSQPLGHDSLMCMKREDMQNSQDLYRLNTNLIYLDLQLVVVEISF